MSRSTQKKTGIPRLLEFAGKYRVHIYMSCLLSAVSAVLTLMPYVCIFFVVREVFRVAPVLTAMDGAAVARYGWLAVGSAASAFVIYAGALLFSHYAAFNTARSMKSQVLHHLVTLPMGFHTTNSSGKLRKIINENSDQTETFLAHQIPDLVGGFVTPVAMIILLFVFDWRLGLVSMIPLAGGFFILGGMMAKKSSGFLKAYQDALEDMNNEAVEYVRGISVVKVFGQTVHSFKSFHTSIVRYRDYVIQYTLSWKRPMSWFTAMINGTFFLLIPAGLLLATSAGDYRSFVLSFIFYIIFTPACAGMLTKVMYVASYRMVAAEAVRRIDDLLDEKPLPGPVHPESPKDASLAFEHVSFSYPGTDLPVLKDVSFRVPPGGTVALVGPSGGGKSTIASLIPRFWDVDAGCVRVGGADVRNIPTSTLMESLSFVFQDARLFKDSVLENIRAARPSASREEVLAAAHAAQCDDIIANLPQGLDTVIGAKGIYLSGGEQQRIALARAILKDAPIIILDEATAFADPENEYRIQQAFENLTKGKTVLMIAHRLSSIQDADMILVIEEGEIAESGTHDGLVAAGGVYARMWTDYRRSVSWSIGKEVQNV